MATKLEASFKRALFFMFSAIFFSSVGLCIANEDKKEWQFMVIDQLDKNQYLIKTDFLNLEILTLSDNENSSIQKINDNLYLLVMDDSTDGIPLPFSIRNLDGIIFQRNDIEVKRIMISREQGERELTIDMGEEGELGNYLSLFVRTLDAGDVSSVPSSHEEELTQSGGGYDAPDDGDTWKKPGGMGGMLNQVSGNLPLFNLMSLDEEVEEVIDSLIFQPSVGFGNEQGLVKKHPTYFQEIADHAQDSVTYCYILRLTQDLQKGNPREQMENKILTELFEAGDELVEEVFGSLLAGGLPVKPGTRMIDREALLKALNQVLPGTWVRELIGIVRSINFSLSEKLSEIAQGTATPSGSRGASLSVATSSPSAGAAAVSTGTLEEGDLLVIMSDFLKLRAAKWREIAQGLGFLPGAINNIEAMPGLYTEAPISFLREVLTQFLRRATNDNYPPTIDTLANAVSGAGLGRVANDIRTRLPGKLNRSMNYTADVPPALNIPLSEENFAELYRSLCDVNWRELGANLKLKNNLLDIYSRQDNPLSSVLAMWLRREQATLKNLCEALNNMGHGRLAESVNKKFTSMLPPRRDFKDLEYGKLCGMLRPHAAHWREIGEGLGFKSSELDNIAADYSLMINGPGGFMDKAINLWMNWGPNDGRGTEAYANSQQLFKVMIEKLNYSNYQAHKAILFIFNDS